jgi:uncharacterized protein YjiS (DUF1127 family)
MTPLLHWEAQMQLNWLSVEPELAAWAPAAMTNSHACGARARPRRRVGWFARARALLGLWRRRIYERTELTELSAHDLRDVGLSDAEVWAETQKWFWQE